MHSLGFHFGSNAGCPERPLCGALIFSMLQWLLPGRQNGNMKYRIVPSADGHAQHGELQTLTIADADDLLKKAVGVACWKVRFLNLCAGTFRSFNRVQDEPSSLNLVRDGQLCYSIP